MANRLGGSLSYELLQDSGDLGNGLSLLTRRLASNPTIDARVLRPYQRIVSSDVQNVNRNVAKLDHLANGRFSPGTSRSLIQC
jgi:hypothetical protein